MARPSNTAERREQIVEGLLEVMAKDGYERATIVAIGKAAGLTPGLVHYHFASKQEVLVALIARLSAQVDARYRARVESATTPLERLHAFIDAHLALGKDADPRAVVAWNVVGAEAVRQPEVRALYRKELARSLAEMGALVGACLEAVGRSGDEADDVAAALVSAIEGAYRIASAAPRGLPRGFAAPMVRRMAEALVGATGASR